VNGPNDMFESENFESKEFASDEFESKDAGAEAFERSLKDALRRVDAPPDFTLQVLKKAGGAAAQLVETPTETQAVWKLERPKARASFAWMHVRWWAGGALAAVLAIGVFAGEHIRREREREVANQQFEAATQIENQALEHAREQLREAGVQGIE
jgi:hypothetical protein